MGQLLEAAVGFRRKKDLLVEDVPILHRIHMTDGRVDL